MIWNAEFRRNIWLEINFTRLIAFPLVLALIFWAFFTGQSSDTADINQSSIHLSGVALVLFGAITVLWGAQLASNSIIEESLAQTWDWQRLSAQHPAILVTGKLFGSTILAWYGGLCCLVAYSIISHSTLGGIKFNWIVLAVSSAIFAQASAMLLALSIPPEQRLVAQQKNTANVSRLFAVVLSLAGGALLLALWGGESSRTEPQVRWYSGHFNQLPFFTLSALVWAAWSVYGCVQRMSTLLRSPTTPLQWLVFSIFCMFYFAGFTPPVLINGQDGHYYGQTAFGVIASLVVGIALFETKAPLQWRLWFNAWRAKQYLRTWQRTPRWIATFVLSLPVFAIALFNSDPAFSSIIAVLPLMFLRDIAVLYWFHWTPQPRRPYLAFAIYLLLVYLLLPFLLKALSWLFYPNPNSPIITLGIFIVETAVAVAFLIQRWDEYYSAEFSRNEEEEHLQQSLIENEKVIYRARVSIGTQAHLFLIGLLIIAVGFALHFYSPLAEIHLFQYSLDNILLSIVLLVALGFWLVAVVKNLIARQHTQLTFTNKRVIIKIGFPVQQNIELPLSKISSIQVSQTQRGRWFNYGNLNIASLGNAPVTIPDIANPSAFRRTLMEAQEHK